MAGVSLTTALETYYHFTSNRLLSAIRPSLSVSLPSRFGALCGKNLGKMKVSAMSGHLRLMSRHLALSSRLGAILGPTWTHHGPILGHLGATFSNAKLFIGKIRYTNLWINENKCV